ncbi:hypothetical protein QBE52_10960 [Clostridiaceae bacterium 35-E11]
MDVYYVFANMTDLIPAEELALPLEVDEGDIYSCYGLLYQVIEKLDKNGKKIYKMKFI